MLLGETFFDAHIIKKFFDYTYPEPNTGCWLWSSCAGSNGYGLIYIKDKFVLAHRFSAMLHFGLELTRSQVVCHKCNNKDCVNPDHLYVGTQSDNMKQAYREMQMKKRAVEQYTLDGRFVAEYQSSAEAGRANGTGGWLISAACRGQSKTSAGFIWKFKKPSQ